MSVVPQHYKLLVAPNIAENTFRGEVDIFVSLIEPTAQIVLHQLDLEIGAGVHVSIGETQWAASSVKADNDAELLILDFAEPLPVADSAVLHLEWTGKLTTELHGLYKTFYLDKDGRRCDAISTHFEPTNARQCFPCWDEPAKKATFAISVIIDAHLHVLSNMPAAATTTMPDTKPPMRKWTFETAPLMSTYLVAIVAGQWNMVQSFTKTGVCVQSWAPIGCAATVRQSNAWATAVLDLFSEYFAVPYPLLKLDIVPVENFPLGGMENFGCITTKRGLVMLSDDASTEEILYMKEILAHEIAHMWFGDLVTMPRWNTLWLKEGFATMLSFLASSRLDGPLGGWSERFLYSYSLVAREMDSLQCARALESSVENSGEANENFDEIGYAKGASIIEMLCAYIGEDSLRQGLKSYVAQFSFRTATANNLWESLGTDIMSSWITQPGFPLISVVRESPTTIRVSQQRFGVDDDSLWVVPLLYVTNLDTKTPQRLLLRDRTALLEIDPAVRFIYLNSGQRGEVLVRYSEPMQAALLKEFEDRSDCNKIGFLSDLTMLLKVGSMPLSHWLDVFESIGPKVVSPSVWHTVAELMNFVMNAFADQPTASSRIKSCALSLFAPKFLEWKKFDAVELMDDNVRLARNSIIRSLSFAEHPEVLNTARQLVKNHGPLGVPADLRESVWTACVLGGDDEAIAKLNELIIDSSVADSSKALALAILCKRKEGTLDFEKRFSWFLGTKPVVKGTMMKSLLAGLHEATQENKTLIWNHIEPQWNVLISAAGGFAAGRAFVQSFMNSNSIVLANRIEAFVAQLPSQQRSFVANTTKRVVEIIHRNHQLAEAVKHGKS